MIEILQVGRAPTLRFGSGFSWLRYRSGASHLQNNHYNPSRGKYQKKPQKVYNSDDLKKIDKQLSKKDEIKVNPISKRFTDNKKEKDENNLSLDEYDGKYTVEINSTAIGFPIRYNKKTGEVWLRFKDKDGKPTGKWYHYVDMDEEQFKSFMKAASKGRYVTKIMKYKNHDPAYGPTPRKRK